MSLERHSLDTIKTVKLDVRQNLQRQAAGRMVYGCGIPGYHMCVVYPQSISLISSFHTHTRTQSTCRAGPCKKETACTACLVTWTPKKCFFSWLVPPVGVLIISFYSQHHCVRFLFLVVHFRPPPFSSSSRPPRTYPHTLDKK